VTIKDIAATLGVSHSTVSRALNDHSHISTAMKERVRSVAADLGYVVNAGARTLRQSSSRLVGVIVPNVLNELFAVMIKVLAARCERAGFQLVLCVTEDDPKIELRHIEMLRQSRAMGLIVVPSPFLLPETARLMSAIPLVQFSRSHPLIAGPTIAIDGAQGIASAVRHLADLGHRRIGYVGLTPDLSTGRARYEGFTAAMAKHGVELDRARTFLGQSSIEFGRASTLGLLRQAQRPTAIVYGSADLTLGGLEATRREGVAVPDDVSIIGFGDPHWLSIFVPSVSTVGLALAESAETAISMLLRVIDAVERGADVVEEPSLELQPFLILRESTAPPPIG
jgi:LacI family transcriptional regulator